MSYGMNTRIMRENYGIKSVRAPVQHVLEIAQETSVMTHLGLIEGEVLTFLEVNGSSLLTRLIKEIAASHLMITMGVGSLIRKGLVRVRLNRGIVQLESNWFGKQGE